VNKIVVLNAGSSSLKYQLIDIETKTVLASGLVERIGEKEVKDHSVALEYVKKTLNETGFLEDWNELGGIGHRVVHGGEDFHEPTVIDEHVIEKIRSLSSLAPLHNPANLLGIEVSLKLAPNVPQVAVFDTAFHQTIPEHSYMYALPYKMYEKYGVRRYGFHGTSHHYVSSQAAKFLKKDLSECNFISLHLGNGSSITAVKNGKSIDTSMGMTPLEGLIMGTRSGDLDPQILIYLATELKMSIEEIDVMLNKKSGLLGISGMSDMREIEESSDKKAKLALKMVVYRLKKYIGSYAVALGRVDALIFTGGIGEHSETIRKDVCDKLDILGIGIDLDKNENVKKDIVEISTDESRSKILVISTNEELEIAIQTQKTLRGDI